VTDTFSFVFPDYLTLSSNSFSYLPSEFGLLTNLRSVYLDKNEFEGELYLPLSDKLGKFELP